MKDNERLSDEALVSTLPGYINEQVRVNNTMLHVVTGGEGTPLLLLPGWPQTWWAYRKVMPGLAKHYKVIAVDIRGMGSSEKPVTGYDKKNLAQDIYELTKYFDFDKVDLAGHDISATIIHSFASQYAERTGKLIFLDTPPLNKSIYQLPMLPPPPGAPAGIYPWWLAFNQVPDIAELLLENRSTVILDHIFDGLTINKNAFTLEDREVYAYHYNRKDNIRAACGWYQAFPEDVLDSENYEKLRAPVLGIAGEGNTILANELPNIAEQQTTVIISGSGHFITEEQPETLLSAMLEFLKA